MSTYYVIDTATTKNQPVTRRQIYFSHFAATQALLAEQAKAQLWVARYDQAIEMMCKENLPQTVIHEYQYQRDLIDPTTMVVRPLTWIERETWRMESEGGYQQPVWVNERWWVRNSHIHRRHFTHISLEDPTMVAYTEDDRKGEADRQTRLRPGRYLKKFFGHILSHQEIEFYSQWMATGARPPRWQDLGDVKITNNDPDMVEDVYRNGPQSCMTDTSAVRVYSGGDLELAYLERSPSMPTGVRRFVARAIVWPEKKAFGRVYPSPDNYHRDGYEDREAAEEVSQHLINQLRRMGYTSIGEQRDCLHGAKIPMYYVGDGAFAMPYIDSGYGVYPDWETKKFVFHYNDGRAKPSGFDDAESTSGAVRFTIPSHIDRNTLPVMADSDLRAPGYTCDECDDEVDAEDIRVVHNPRNNENGHVCLYCLERNEDGYYCQTNAGEWQSDWSGTVYAYNMYGHRITMLLYEAEQEGLISDHLGYYFNPNEVEYYTDSDGDIFCEHSVGYNPTEAEAEEEEPEDLVPLLEDEVTPIEPAVGFAAANPLSSSPS